MAEPGVEGGFGAGLLGMNWCSWFPLGVFGV